MGGLLTGVQADRFRRCGYLVYRRPLLPAAEFAALKDSVRAILAKLPPGHRRFVEAPHYTNRALFRWILSPRLLDLVESLIGPDIAVFSTQIFHKKPGDGGFEWHQDQDSTTDGRAPAGVRLWIALTPSDRRNGCVKVFPGSHRERSRRPARGRNGWGPARPLELGANQAFFMNPRLIHGSGVNRSRATRTAYCIHYASTATNFGDLKYPMAPSLPVYLARGRDRAGNVYADLARTYKLSRIRYMAKRLKLGTLAILPIVGRGAGPAEERGREKRERYATLGNVRKG